MPLFTVFVLEDSSALGRLDYASLSQQTLMEMMIAKMTTKEHIFGNPEVPRDIADWKGVTLNEKQEITKIQWLYAGHEGEIDLQWMPPTVQSFRLISSFGLKGSIDLTKLPDTMVHLDVEGSKFDGTIDLTNLPRTINKIILHNCGFEGTVDLTKLPESLEHLELTWNTFSGPVDLTHLPQSLEYLSLSDSGFSGETDFSKLPANLSTLDVSMTELSGTVFVEGDEKNIKAYDSSVNVYVKMMLQIRNDSGKMLIDKGNESGTLGYINQNIWTE